MHFEEIVIYYVGQTKQKYKSLTESVHLGHIHKCRNTVHKNAVTIIGASILNSIDKHGLSNESFKVRVKNYSGAATDDICGHFKPEIWNKSDVVIIPAGTNDLTSNSKSLENYGRIAYSLRSKLPNWKLAICNATTRNDKDEIGKKSKRLGLNLIEQNRGKW